MSTNTTNKNYFHSKGKNAEKLVHNLAIKTFLTDWCYLNPKLPNGKELCDLLVVFDNIAIIWQIKDLKLNTGGKYKKSEVEKNLRQLSGARRHMFKLKTVLELENPRRGKEKFDPKIIKEIYLLSVLLGECEEHFSFVEEIKDRTVHIFTKEFTQLVLNELDTVKDFVDYLRAKEALIAGDKRIFIIGGEEELLAVYLMKGRSFGRLKSADGLVITQGSWEHLQSMPEYTAKKEADKISYGWDSIINKAHEGSSKYEEVARELARPNRFERRCLSKTFFDAHIRAHRDDKHTLYRRILFGDNITYCFLFQDDPEPRDRRKAMLAAICWFARGKFKKNRKVIGIATEKKIRHKCSYDFCLLDIPKWTEKYQKQMEKLQKETGMFVNPIVGHIHEDEYPQVVSDSKSGEK